MLEATSGRSIYNNLVTYPLLEVYRLFHLRMAAAWSILGPPQRKNADHCRRHTSASYWLAHYSKYKGLQYLSVYCWLNESVSPAPYSIKASSGAARAL